jgi:hypothetical protein
VAPVLNSLEGHISALTLSVLGLKPAETVVQNAAPSLEYLPLSQTVHFNPSPFLPDGHEEQPRSLVAVHSVTVSVPGPHGSQMMQEAWPVEGWKKLVLHAVHEGEAAPENVPSGQSSQLPALTPLCLPLGQFEHDSAPEDANVPARHSRQVVAPRPAYVPASHEDAQEAEPGALNLPASQLMHASLLSDEYLPPAHS